MIGDGLSSWAVERQAVPLIRALLPYLRTLGIGLAPVVLAHQSRVALGDDIGETLKARAVASTSPGSLIVSAWSLSATVSPIFGRRD